MEVSLKLVAGAFSAMQINTIRFLVGGIALIPFALREIRRRKLSIDAAAIVRMSFYGFLCVILSMGFYQLGIGYIPANASGVLFCSNTAFVLVFARWILKAPINGKQITAVVLACIGIVFIVNPLHISLPVIGLAHAIAAPIVFALYAVTATRDCHRYSGVVVTCGSFLTGSIELLLILALCRIPAVADLACAYGLSCLTHVDLLAGFTPKTTLLMTYIAIGISGGGYACYFMAIEASSPLAASLVFFFKPILVPILALVVLGEPIPLNMLFGILLILAGSAFSILAQLQATMPATLELWRQKTWLWKKK